ncbi:hypothetical protein AYL99_11571 [Fonsecaea erecta]|uniref:Uncharacterized protein n=1 Tax=Fonsecaea erecta TaxID=1367422 RepID=A0A178Z3Z9_9EURO|nr:hypothetical protein AYL99_11571 [Fonsecaea erecta]OAP54470.1 hypothetical protein AYL99_11571 [Fonsecaea erecta]
MSTTSHSCASTNEMSARPKTVDGQDTYRNGPQAQSDTPEALAEYSEYLSRCIAIADNETATSTATQQQQQPGKKRKWASAHKK